MGAETCTISTPAGMQHACSAGIFATLTPGSLSMLLDTGPNITMTSINTAREFDQQSAHHGRAPKVMKLGRLLHVSGVGRGAAICRALGRFRHACKFQHHDKPLAAKSDGFVGNTAEGSASDPPAILGLTL
eukprot:5345828-Pyramimonas_sp.AAC.1